MKTTFKKLCISLLLFLATGNAFAQVSGFGAGFTGESDPYVNYPIKLDDVKDEVGSTFPGFFMTPDEIELTFMGHGNYENFQNGDMCLLIQMKGTGIGTHQNVTITSGGGTSTVWVKTVNGSFIEPYYPYYYGIGNDHVQLVKIHVYDNFTLNNGGLVTCDPWNGHIGGVLPMIVQNTLTINGGSFNVSGKGFRPEDDPSYSGGIGGNGGNGIVNNYSASKDAPDKAYLFNGATCELLSLSFLNSTKGSRGGSAGTLGSLGSSNSGGGATYGGAAFYDKLVMGNPGYYVTGASPPYRGAKGGQGGGGGGIGANSTCSPNGSGQSGEIGYTGEQGGNAGKGGNGGGVMVIKADDLVINYRGVSFEAAGAAGQSGGKGGNGGLGGKGGAGGASCCIDIGSILQNSPEGGPGGNGNYGSAGNGADAGNGGKPGYMWISTNSFTNNTASYPNPALAFTEMTNVLGGKAGRGGEGGLGNFNATQPRNMYNACFQSYCAPVCPITECDPHKAMCIFKDFLYTVNTGTDIEFWNGSTKLAKYNYANNLLEAYDSDNCHVYVAYWRSTTIGSLDPDAFFKYFAGIDTATFVNYPPINNPVNTIATGCLISPEIDFNKMLRYMPDRTEIVDYTNSYGIVASVCVNDGYGHHYTNSGDNWPVGLANPLSVSSGRNGVSGTNGTTDDTGIDPNANGKLDLPGSFLVRKKNDNTTQMMDMNNKADKLAHNITQNATQTAAQIEMKTYPNPADKYITVEWAGWNTENVTIIIKDIMGRIILTQTAKQKIATNKVELEIEQLKAGVYFVELSQETKTYKTKITIQ